MYDHPQYHKLSNTPIEGCLECDIEIGRPLKLSFGLGKSNIVIWPTARPTMSVLSSSLSASSNG